VGVGLPLPPPTATVIVSACDVVILEEDGATDTVEASAETVWTSAAETLLEKFESLVAKDAMTLWEPTESNV
jgi:hypothetical protein